MAPADDHSKRRRRRWLQVGAAIAVLLLGALLIVSSFVDFRKSPAEIEAFFEGKPEQPRYGSYLQDDQQMHFAEIGVEDNQMVLFIHGSPGAWDHFLAYFDDRDLLSRARLVSVDRPGFGGSAPHQAVPSLARQATAIQPILAMDDSAAGPVVVGHSLGGPVALQLAMDYPDQVGSLILLAPSVDPDLENVRWYQHLAEWPIVRWFVPSVLLTANREIMPLKKQLTQLDWTRVQQPVTVIHGAKDSLVPVENATHVTEHLPQAELIRLPEANHFLPWTHEGLIRQKILDHLASEEQP